MDPVTPGQTLGFVICVALLVVLPITLWLGYKAVH